MYGFSSSDYGVTLCSVVTWLAPHDDSRIAIVLTAYSPLRRHQPILLRATRAIPEHCIPEGALLAVSSDGTLRRVYWQAPEVAALLDALDAGALEILTPGADARDRLQQALRPTLVEPNPIRWPSDSAEIPAPPPSPDAGAAHSEQLRLVR